MVKQDCDSHRNRTIPSHLRSWRTILCCHSYREKRERMWWKGEGEKGLDCKGKLICVQGHVAKKIAFFPQQRTEGEDVVSPMIVQIKVNVRLCMCVCVCECVQPTRCHHSGLCAEVVQNVFITQDSWKNQDWKAFNKERPWSKMHTITQSQEQNEEKKEMKNYLINLLCAKRQRRTCKGAQFACFSWRTQWEKDFSFCGMTSRLNSTVL